MPPDWEFYVQMALRIVGLGTVVLVLHNVLKLIVSYAEFSSF